MATELRGQLIGGWTAGRYLGSGYSAVVLEAERQEQKAALKIIDPELVERAGTEHQLKRILRERELAGHGHPNLVDILDGGQCAHTKFLFVAMELLEPRTLGQVRQKLQPTQIAPLIAQLGRAAHFLEERGIAHRDIKPDNTFVTSDYTQVKLLDLGVIHPPADPNDPSAGTGDRFVGTARYSPPEFLYREEEDTVECWRAITFYQLGATLYDLLMRQPIFEEFRDPPARLYQAVRTHVPVIDSGGSEPWLINLARRCLHKDWRVRKELICWEDFEGPRLMPESAEEIRQRLRKRFAAARTKAAATSKGKQVELTRATLRQLAGSLATSAREARQQGGIFPPVEVRDSVLDGKSVVTVRAGPSNAHGLNGILEIRIVIHPLDAEAEYVRISAAARLEGFVAETEEHTELFVGEPSSPNLRECIDIYLHAALEASLDTGTPPEGGLPIHPVAKRI